jgi:nitrate/nitrite-specific signal transduction histidine kinase
VNIDDLRETIADIYKSEKDTRFFEVLAPIFVHDKLLNIVGTSVPGNETDSQQSKDLIGDVRIIVSFASIDKELARVSNIVTIISIGVILLGLGLSFVFVKILLGSLGKLVIGDQKISTGDFSYIVPLGNIKEIEYLINAFNLMGNTLEKTLKSLSDEKSDKMLKMFFSELNRSNRIISELLTFSRLVNVKKTFAYVDDVVHNCCACNRFV